MGRVPSHHPGPVPLHTETRNRTQSLQGKWPISDRSGLHRGNSSRRLGAWLARAPFPLTQPTPFRRLTPRKLARRGQTDGLGPSFLRGSRHIPPLRAPMRAVATRSGRPCEATIPGATTLAPFAAEIDVTPTETIAEASRRTAGLEHAGFHIDAPPAADDRRQDLQTRNDRDRDEVPDPDTDDESRDQALLRSALAVLIERAGGEIEFTLADYRAVLAIHGSHRLVGVVDPSGPGAPVIRMRIEAS